MKNKKKNIINGQEFIDALEKDLIDEIGEEEHKKLLKAYEKKLNQLMKDKDK